MTRSIRRSRFWLALVLLPGLLGVDDCVQGDTDLEVLEFKVNGVDQVQGFDPALKNYPVTTSSSTATLRAVPEDLTGLTTYQWFDVTGMNFISGASIGYGGGEIPVDVPMGTNRLRVFVYPTQGDAAFYTVVVTREAAQTKTLTLACRDSVLGTDIPFVPVDLTVEPVGEIIAGAPFSANISGAIAFPESLLDLAQALGPIKRAEFEDLRVVVAARSGATGPDVFLSRVPIATTCALYESSPGVPAACDPFNDDPMDGSNSDCLNAGGLPNPADHCGEFYDAPIEEDCSVCDTMTDSGFGVPKSNQCAVNGFCIAGAVLLPLQTELGQYLADMSVGSQVVFGLAEGGPDAVTGGTTGATRNPPPPPADAMTSGGSWNLPEATLASPVVQGLRASVLNAISVGLECTMGVDTGTGPGTPTVGQRASPTADALLISFPIVDICDAMACPDDGNECTNDVCVPGVGCDYPPANGATCDLGGNAGVCVNGGCVQPDRPAEARSIPVACSPTLASWFATQLDTTIDPDIAYAGEPFTATSSATSLVLTQEMLQHAVDQIFLIDISFGGALGPVAQLEVDPLGSQALVSTVSGVTGTDLTLVSAAPPYVFDVPAIPFADPFPNTGGEPCVATPNGNSCPYGGITDVLPQFPNCINGFCGQTCTNGFCDPLPCPTPESCPPVVASDFVIPFADAALMGANSVGGLGEEVCFDQRQYPQSPTTVRMQPLGAPGYAFQWVCYSGTPASPSGPVIPNPISEPPLMCIPVVPFCIADSDCPPSTEQCMIPACIDGACVDQAAPDDDPCDYFGVIGKCTGGECFDAMICEMTNCDDGVPCTRDVCHPQDGSCSNDAPPPGGCFYDFDLSGSSFRHYSSLSSPKPECLPPDLSVNPGADLGGIEDQCFIETLPNTGTVSFRDLGGGQWEVAGSEQWVMPSPTGYIDIDSTVDFVGTGTGTVEDGGQIVLDPISGSFNVVASESGSVDCSAGAGVCDALGYQQGQVALPLANDPGMRTLPTLTFQSPTPGDPLEVMLAGGSTDPTGWYLRNPAPMSYTGREWASLSGSFVGNSFDFCAGVDCDDADQCTTDSCDDGTCSNIARSDGASCDFGGNPGACISGTCEAVCDWLNCGDNNDCTTDSCDPIAGACVNTTAPDGTSCFGGRTSCFDGVCQGKTITMGCTNTLSSDTHIVDLNLIVEPNMPAPIFEFTPFDAWVAGEFIFPQSILDELDVIPAATISEIQITVEAAFGSSGVLSLGVLQPNPTCLGDESVECDPLQNDPFGANPACTGGFGDTCEAWFRNTVSTDCSPDGTCETIGKAAQCAAHNRCVTGPVVFPLDPTMGTFFAASSGNIEFGLEGGAPLNPDGTYQLQSANTDPAQNGPNYGIGAAPEGTGAMNCIMAVDSNGPDGVGVPDGASPSPPDAFLSLPVRVLGP